MSEVKVGQDLGKGNVFGQHLYTSTFTVNVTKYMQTCIMLYVRTHIGSVCLYM